MLTLSLLFFFVLERSVCMVLVFYYKGMLEMVMKQRTQKISDFSLLSKESMEMQRMCSWVARKFETQCFCRNLPISNNEFQETWQKYIVQKPCE